MNKKTKKVKKYQFAGQGGDPNQPYDPTFNPTGYGAPIPANPNGSSQYAIPNNFADSNNQNYGAYANQQGVVNQGNIVPLKSSSNPTFNPNVGSYDKRGTFIPYKNAIGDAIDKGFNYDSDGKYRKTEIPGGALGYSGGFQALNTGLDVIRGVAGQVNDIKNSNQERQKLLKARYNQDSYSPYEAGFNQVNEYYQIGGGTQPTYQVDNKGRQAWNKYVTWLQGKNLAGSPSLDKNGYGKQVLAQYMKEVPNSGLTQDNVVPIQKDFENYRTWAINKGIPNGDIVFDTSHGTNPQNFMQKLSKIDGYPGSNTTLHQFPDAYLKQFTNGQLTSVSNVGYATPETAQHLQNGGLSSDKAKEILRDGTANGHKLTDKQKRYFGYIAGGGTPQKQMGGPNDAPDFPETLFEAGNANPNYYKNGGSKIHIKKSHEGEFKAYAKSIGMSTQAAAHHVMAHSKDSKLRKQANFALNAAHWKKQNGGNIINNTGYLPQYATSDNPYNIIPSNDITMNGVPHDVMAYPNVGKPTLMKQNGGKYTFPGAQYVTEFPVYQDGGQDPTQQQGGDQDQQAQQMQQIIQAYAQLIGQDPQQIIKQLQSLPPDQQQQAIQQMVQAVQQAQQQGGGQQDPNQQQQQAPQQQMQQGGTPQVGSVPNGQATAELEQGEVFQDPRGQIKKVAETEDRHEDGGSMQNNVSRVLEDTADKRKDPDSKTLRISPEEAYQMTGFKPKGNLTHSKLYEQATEYYDTQLAKMQKDINTNLDYVKYNNGGKYAQNSLDENLRTLQELPTKGQLFDNIYDHQEDVKRKYNISQDAQQMQNGGKLPKYQVGKTLEDPTQIDPETYDPTKHGGQTYDDLVNAWEKTQNYPSNGISPRSPSKGNKYVNVYNDQFLGLKPLIPAYYRDNASTQSRPDLQLQQGNTFGNLNDYNLPQFLEVNPWAKQFIGTNGQKLTPDNVKAMQSYYNKYMTNNYNTPYFTGNSAGVDAKFGEETAGLAPVLAGTINYDNATDLAQKTKNYIHNTKDNVYLDKNSPIYYNTQQNPQAAPEKAGAPPINTQYGKPNGANPSSFNEPLHWYDVAGDVSSYLSAIDRYPVDLEQLHRQPLKAHELDPLPTLLKNQGDYNAALQQLPQSGVGFANQANLLGNKYKVNNEVLGQYENANKEKLDRVDEINNNNQYQLDQTNLGLRDQFNNRVLQGKEVQREQKLKSLNNFYDKVAQNAAFNRNGNLLLKMTPYFDQQGNFNGNQYTLKNNAAGGQDILDKKTGKVVDTLDGQGNLKSQRITYNNR